MARPRNRTLLIMVSAGLIVPALALTLMGIKLVYDFTEVARGIRVEYASYISRIAASAVEDAVWESEQVTMVGARLEPPETPNEIVSYLNDILDSSALYRFGFFVSPVGLSFYSQPDPMVAEPNRPLPDWIERPILASLNRYQEFPSGVLHLTAPDSLPPTQVTFFTVHSAGGELLGASGFIWNLEGLKGDSAFLQRGLGRQLSANDQVFQGTFLDLETEVALIDEADSVFYATGSATDNAFESRRAFDRVLPFYSVGVRLSDDRFDRWVRGIVVTNLAVVASMFFVIVLAMALTLRFILRTVELSELKSTLVSNVSHELKTPLALIRLYSETLMLGRAGTPEREKEFLGIIHAESERLTNLINNILEVGRIDQDRKTYNMARDDLSELVRGTLKAYEYQLVRDGFKVETLIEDGVDDVRIDRDAMTQAILNLMDNAIKYSKEQRFLRVGVERKGSEALVFVEDRGVGIAAGEHERIFEKFYRVERGLVHNVKGSGLGLSLVHHIVEAHGGRVEVVSRPGSGSRFVIHLPLDRNGSTETDQGETA